MNSHQELMFVVRLKQWHSNPKNTSHHICLTLGIDGLWRRLKKTLNTSTETRQDNSNTVWNPIICTEEEILKTFTIMILVHNETTRWLGHVTTTPIIWLVEWGQIIVLHVQHAIRNISLGSLWNGDVKFSYLRFWRQREPTAIQLSPSEFT